MFTLQRVILWLPAPQLESNTSGVCSAGCVSRRIKASSRWMLSRISLCFLRFLIGSAIVQHTSCLSLDTVQAELCALWSVFQPVLSLSMNSVCCLLSERLFSTPKHRLSPLTVVLPSPLPVWVHLYSSFIDRCAKEAAWKRFALSHLLSLSERPPTSARVWFRTASAGGRRCNEPTRNRFPL